MPQLPVLDYEYTDREVTDTFAGYNHKLKIGAGEFYDTENLTSAYYPLLAERKKRGLVKQLTAPGGLLGKEKLAYVDNGTLWYNGEPTALTGLTAGEKQLVSMGAYICVFPDKKYYNTADADDYGSMEAYYTSTGTVKYTMCRADGSEYARPTVSAAAPEEPENAALWIDISQSRAFRPPLRRKPPTGVTSACCSRSCAPQPLPPSAVSGSSRTTGKNLIPGRCPGSKFYLCSLILCFQHLWHMAM